MSFDFFWCDARPFLPNDLRVLEGVLEDREESGLSPKPFRDLEGSGERIEGPGGEVDRDQDPPRRVDRCLALVISSNGQDWARGIDPHLLRNAPEEEARKPTTPVGSYDDEVRSPLFRFERDLLAGEPTAEDHFWAEGRDRCFCDPTDNFFPSGLPHGARVEPWVSTECTLFGNREDRGNLGDVKYDQVCIERACEVRRMIQDHSGEGAAIDRDKDRLERSHGDLPFTLTLHFRGRGGAKIEDLE